MIGHRTLHDSHATRFRDARPHTYLYVCPAGLRHMAGEQSGAALRRRHGQVHYSTSVAPALGCAPARISALANTLITLSTDVCTQVNSRARVVADRPGPLR